MQASQRWVLSLLSLSTGKAGVRAGTLQLNFKIVLELGYSYQQAAETMAEQISVSQQMAWAKETSVYISITRDLA